MSGTALPEASSCAETAQSLPKAPATDESPTPHADNSPVVVSVLRLSGAKVDELVAARDKLVKDAVAHVTQGKGHLALLHRGQDLICTNGDVVQQHSIIAHLVGTGPPYLELTLLNHGALDHAWLLVVTGNLRHRIQKLGVETADEELSPEQSQLVQLARQSMVEGQALARPDWAKWSFRILGTAGS